MQGRFSEGCDLADKLGGRFGHADKSRGQEEGKQRTSGDQVLSKEKTSTVHNRIQVSITMKILCCSYYTTECSDKYFWLELLEGL